MMHPEIVAFYNRYFSIENVSGSPGYHTIAIHFIDIKKTRYFLVDKYYDEFTALRLIKLKALL